MAARLAWSRFVLSVLFLTSAASGAIAQGAGSSYNPAAAASDIRNPSSINPAARASDIRDSTSINPAAAASDRRRFGVTVQDAPSVVNRQPALSRTIVRPDRRARQVRRSRSRGESARVARNKRSRAAQPARAPQKTTKRKTSRAAAGILGSVCRGC